MPRGARNLPESSRFRIKRRTRLAGFEPATRGLEDGVLSRSHAGLRPLRASARASRFRALRGRRGAGERRARDPASRWARAPSARAAREVTVANALTARALGDVSHARAAVRDRRIGDASRDDEDPGYVKPGPARLCGAGTCVLAFRSPDFLLSPLCFRATGRAGAAPVSRGRPGFAPWRVQGRSRGRPSPRPREGALARARRHVARHSSDAGAARDAGRSGGDAGKVAGRLRMIRTGRVTPR